MALVGCEWNGHTEPPLKNIKKWPPMNDIALFLRSSTRTVASLK